LSSQPGRFSSARCDAPRGAIDLLGEVSIARAPAPDGPPGAWRAYAGMGVLIASPRFMPPWGPGSPSWGGLVAMFRIAGVRTWRAALLGAVTAAAVSYLVFELWLGVRFQAGPVG